MPTADTSATFSAREGARGDLLGRPETDREVLASSGELRQILSSTLSHLPASGCALPSGKLLPRWCIGHLTTRKLEPNAAHRNHSPWNASLTSEHRRRPPSAVSPA